MLDQTRSGASRVLAFAQVCSEAARRSNERRRDEYVKEVWWGKLAGGTLGLVVGGWIGGLVGVLLGHQLDEGISRELGRDEESPKVDDGRIQLEFFTTTFSVMGHLAKADGRVSEDEIAAARRVMRRMNLSREQKREAIRLFEEGKRGDFPLGAVLQSFRARCQGRRDLLHTFTAIQLEAALADGQIHSDARRVLWQVCSELEISRLELAQLEAMVRAQGGRTGPATAAPADRLGHAYGVLGVDRAASDDDVKMAYRRLMSRHHPDKLIAKGLPQEMLDLARDKAREINTAYDLIKETRGFH
jgi:DnaJ like chaperone protein